MEPIYRQVVLTHDDWDPEDLTTFDLDTFLAAHNGPSGVPEQAQPRKASRRARRS